MGCGASSVEEYASIRSKRIDEELKKCNKESSAIVKILLLGSGESGKSTLVKQMRVIHGNGYTPGESKCFTSAIHSNTIQGLFSILLAMQKLQINFAERSIGNDIKQLYTMTGNSCQSKITLELGEIMQRIWRDQGVQTCFSRSREYQLSDSAGYYLNLLSLTSGSGYVPTQQDVLKAQIHTTGINTSHFIYNDLRFDIYDVGGQRSERKKWLHCFEGVNAVIFCVALSEYDLVLREDESVNRMQESMKLFNSICNNKWFFKTPIILFLNKIDLFKEKIDNNPLAGYFPEYHGSLVTYTEAIAYIQERFESLNTFQMIKPVYTHITCATDTESIHMVVDNVMDEIIADIKFSMIHSLKLV